MNFKACSYTKDVARFISFALLACCLTLCVASCASPPEPQEPIKQAVVEIQPAVIILEPKTVDISAPGQPTLYGAGFSPNMPVTVSLVGKWKLGQVEVEDPSIAGAETNEYGAFKSPCQMSSIISVYGLEPGLYTIKAIQGDHTAPYIMELTSAKK